MDSTRISDLPENITMNTSAHPPAMNYGHNDGGDYMGGARMGNHAPPQLQTYQPTIDPNNGGMHNANYMQMNVHPNPYGTSHGDPIGLPQQTHAMKPSNNPYISQAERPVHLNHLPQHQLPSRDIPRDTTMYSHDEEIAPNYIPPPKITNEFVREYEETMAKNDTQNTLHKKAERKMDHFFVELRVPLIITLLFMLFQSPVFQAMILKHLTPLGVYGLDGNITITGVLIKSLLFGTTYYLFEKAVQYIQ
jgi:hypothetical protein